ncbi:glycosyltransferase family 4 protein [Niveibacterium sp.]|uniref:glycosyltransferase family 4 protein n=1 Tax=Niveibacterium sp. TaxID=2017444 RepID=UPI0035B13094
MRVLHFYKTYRSESWGGIEQVMWQLCSASKQHGIRSEVLTLSRHGGDIDYDGHRVHRARLDFEIASNGFSASALRRLAVLARDVDVIHYHFPWPFMDLAHFMTRVNKPTVVSYHSDIIRQRHWLKLYSPLMRRFLASVSRIVVASPNYLRTSAVLAQLPQDKIDVVPYGLDRSAYPEPSPEQMAAWAARFGPRFFLFVGVLRYYKGLHILIEAARSTDYPVVIVGAGPVEAELRAQVQQLGLHNVHFLGPVEEVDKVALIRLCHAMVFPSHLRSEAFGISLLEGAMYGKPLISSEIGTGTSYINIDGETGHVVPPSDPEAFRAAMRDLWEQPARAAEMGEQAAARFERLFTSEMMIGRYMQIYRQLAHHTVRAGVPVSAR